VAVEIAALIFFILSLLLGVVIGRSISIISFYRDLYDDIYSRLYMFEGVIGRVLEKEIYVSDPVIRELVDELRDLQSYINQLEEQQTFSSLGEKIDE
jgi:MFS superfamily sulfate permease-like transporter